MRLGFVAVLLAILAGCTRPPPSALVSGGGGAGIDLGRNAANEDCSQSAPPGAHETAVLCGAWTDPAARVAGGDPAPPGGLAALANNSGWREGLDARATCPDPAQPATVLGAPALRLSCRLRLGGWPYIGLVTIIDGRGWTADGVAPAEAPMVRSIGVLAGRVGPREAASVDAGLAARRAASAAFSAGDMANYRQLLRDARYANNSGDYGGAETADHTILELQRRVQGPDAPALAATLADEAVQVSDLGRFGNSAKLLAEADRLIDRDDPNAVGRVRQARGLDLLNQKRYADALAALQRAEAAFRSAAPPGFDTDLRTASSENGFALHDAAEEAIFGVVETRRAEAVALRHLGRVADSEAAARSASRIAAAHGMQSPQLVARLERTQAFVFEAAGDRVAATRQLQAATSGFEKALPHSITAANTALLLAGREAGAHEDRAALAHCRNAIAVLRTASTGTAPGLLTPCLDVMDRTGAPAGELFEVAQFGQSTAASRRIASAIADLQRNAQDPRVGKLLRERADLNAELDTLTQRQIEANATDPGLTAQINKLRAAQQSTDLALQAVSESYASLITEEKPVTARDALAALGPDEALLSVLLSPDRGWAFLLRRGEVHAVKVSGGAAAMGDFVRRVRASLDTAERPPPPFDTAASASLYDALLRPFAAALDGARTLIVAPSGPLLSIPFGLLLTGPAAPEALATAPWLVQRFTIAHVPTPAVFLALRRQAGHSAAPDPWFGFGGVQPPTLAQAEASFPPASCGRAARLLARLPPLPGAELELAVVRQIVGGSPADQLTGADFTRSAILKADLRRARVLHFATHALMPGELPCISEPALIISDPPAARDASGSFLTSTDIRGLKLDADLVILSACNSGGGKEGGEDLNGLAQNFFHAGTRALLVTHWAVNDQATAYLVALTAQQLAALGPAGALAAAQRKMIAGAKGDLALQAHPFYWAPLAVIGAAGGNYVLF